MPSWSDVWYRKTSTFSVTMLTVIAGAERETRSSFSGNIRGALHEPRAQARGKKVNQHHQGDQDEQPRRRRRVVERPQVVLDVEADAARPDEAENGRGPDIGLESVEREREELRHELGENAPAQHLER